MRFFIFLFILLIGAIAYLSFHNQGHLIFFLTQEVSFEVPVVALILFSVAFGGLLVIAGVGIQEVKNLLLNWKAASRQKREARIQETYTGALNALLAKRHTEAQELFEKLLEIEPNHVQSLWRLGNLKRQGKNFLEAIRLHRKARALDEHNVEVLLALAKDLEEAQRPEESIQVLMDVLKSDSMNLTALAWIRDLYVKLNRWEEGHHIQEKVMKMILSPEEAAREKALFLGIKYELGRLYLEKRMRDQARKYFKGTIRLDRNFLPGYIGLGEASIQEGKQNHAAELWEKAYHLTANIILLHRLEDLFVEMGEPEKIIRIYQEAVAKNPTDRILKFYLGKLYYRLEMLEDAFEVLNGIDVSDERFPDLYKLLGNLYLRQGDLKLAVEEFKKALNLKKRVVVPYYCPVCDFHTLQWFGRCPRCAQWNTFEASPIVVPKSQEKRSLNRVWGSGQEEKISSEISSDVPVTRSAFGEHLGA
jgi:lipopolysaccharide biosynthesis regulator YciM